MKKMLFIGLMIMMVLAVGILIPEAEEYDYLRLHIRANSNLNIDQNVKYKIKDEMVDFLTPYLCNVTSKSQAEQIITEKCEEIESLCDKILSEHGLNYASQVKISNEYFPTRSYCNTTLESGYYDAVIVELGEAQGDNWWCVMYPPLCFVNKSETSTQIKYKSRLVEFFKGLFD